MDPGTTFSTQTIDGGDNLQGAPAGFEGVSTSPSFRIFTPYMVYRRISTYNIRWALLRTSL